MSREIQYFNFSEDTVGIFDKITLTYVPVENCTKIAVDGNIFFKFKRPIQKCDYHKITDDFSIYSEDYSIELNKDIWINMLYREVIQELKEVPEWVSVSYEEAKSKVEERLRQDYENQPSFFRAFLEALKGNYT